MPTTTRPTLSGIDIAAPGGLEALFAYHRSRFGGARMMSEPPPEGTGGDTVTTTVTPSSTQPVATQTTTATPPPDGAPAPARIEDLPDWAQKEIRDRRKEAGDKRTALTAAEQRQQDMLDGIAKALGLKTDEAPPDPAVLQQNVAQSQERITTLEGEIRVRDVELAAFRSASQLGADAAALLDSRAFVTDLSRLDPAADDFGKQVEGAIKKAVDANPRFRATPVPTPGTAGIGSLGNGGQPLADLDSDPPACLRPKPAPAVTPTRRHLYSPGKADHPSGSNPREAASSRTTPCSAASSRRSSTSRRPRPNPPHAIEGNAYAYNVEATLPGVAFRSVNEAYVESTGTFNQKSESFVILGGDADVDRFIVQTRGNLLDQRPSRPR
jgi:hypothetical protein